MIPIEWLDQAEERIAPFIHETPLTFDADRQCWLKWENRQITGSFKLRGALNKILSLQPWERERGLVAASAGNHGQGVAWSARQLGVPALIFVPEHATPAKVAAMQAMGAEVRLVPGGYGEAEAAGLSFARDTGRTWVSPYNDGQLIAGQGTLAREILRQLGENFTSTWLVPVGGGGLAAGIGLALSQQSPRSRLIGVQSEASAYMWALLRGQSQQSVVETDSLADGLAGPVEEGSVTVPLSQRYLDDLILVREDEIAAAIRFAWQQYHEKIEGSAAVGLAAQLSGKMVDGPNMVILSGGNIQPEVHAGLCGGAPDETTGGLR